MVETITTRDILDRLEQKFQAIKDAIESKSKHLGGTL